MELYIIRHAIAVNRDDPQVSSDAERWLTKDGIKKMETAAEGLKKIVPKLDDIFTSPFLRGKQTGEIVAKIFGEKNIVKVTTHLAPGVDFDSLEELTKNHSPNSRIAFVGHEPDMSEMIAYLAAGNEEANIKMKKGAVCRIDADGKPVRGNGLLMWLLAPKHLRMLGGAKS